MTKMNNKYKFTKDWITRFTQSDGSFMVGFSLRGKRTLIPKYLLDLDQYLI